MSMLHHVLQRIRVVFAVSEPMTYVSVLDMGRTWERLLRRAQIPITYSQGFNPHAQLQFATALPVGYSSECEMVDLSLGEEMVPEELLADLSRQLPKGLRVLDAYAVEIKSKSLQALMREARYSVTIYTPSSPAQVDQAIERLLEQEDIPRERRKKKGRISAYNLRPLVLDVQRTESCSAWHKIEMRVVCSPQGSGRPEEIVQELGLTVSQHTITRTELIWKRTNQEAD